MSILRLSISFAGIDQPFFQCRFQLFDPLALHRGDRHDLDRRESVSQRLQILPRRQIHLVGNYKPRTLRQSWIVEIDFPPKILQILDRIAAFTSGSINHENQKAAARNVSQKIVAESEIAVRTFDQSRNIGDRGAAITRKLNYADNRMQRGE